MAYIKKNFSGNSIYVYVVENKRVEGKPYPIQELICSLGEINELIKKLKGWIK